MVKHIHPSKHGSLKNIQRKVWRCFQQYSKKYHEQFTAAARVIAEIISLVEYLGNPCVWIL